MGVGLTDSDNDQKARSPSTKNEYWDTEYHELSEDFRHLRTVGWQAPFAVLALDGVMLVPVTSLAGDNTFLAFVSASLLLFVAGLFTIFMGIDVLKWIARGDIRAQRLAEYDRQAGFGRYFPDEPLWMKTPVAKGMAWLVLVVGLGLVMTAPILIVLAP
jgi:hypothetical protein